LSKKLENGELGQSPMHEKISNKGDKGTCMAKTIVLPFLLFVTACSEFMYRPTMDDFHKSYIYQVMEHRVEARRRFESGRFSENRIDKPIWAFQKAAEDSRRGETTSWYIDTFSNGSYTAGGSVQRADGTYCRNIFETVSVNRSITTRTVNACRTGKAPWRWEPQN
jgi:hypothetical protein